jgi:hypothetical protein
MTRTTLLNGLLLALALAACAWVGPAKAGSVNLTSEDCANVDARCYP